MTMVNARSDQLIRIESLGYGAVTAPGSVWLQCKENVRILYGELKAATERAEAWKELAKLRDKLISSSSLLTSADWKRLRELRERLGES